MILLSSNYIVFRGQDGYGFAEPFNVYPSLYDLVLHYALHSLEVEFSSSFCRRRKTKKNETVKSKSVNSVNVIKINEEVNE